MHLIIAEKNISAQRIAQILSSGQKLATAREGGVPVYSFGDTVVVGLKGHVVDVDFLPEYSDWRSPEYTPRSLIEAPIIKKVSERRIVNLIQKLGKKADHVTIATDYDTEGELIGKEAFDLIRAVNGWVPVLRAKFSAITPQEIRAAFGHPSELDMALASAGEARQVIDLVWGASLTRFISLAARRGGTSILSVGRVQSPTLAMIVDREKEIEAFVPEPYWTLRCISEKDSISFEAEHAHGRFGTEREATAARDRTMPPLVVMDVKLAEKMERPPAPFDTTTFIVAAARLGLGAARAMQVAEDLYMNGYISYPRTDNTVYPKTLTIDALLSVLGSTECAADVAWVREHRRSSPTRGKKETTDHPPIHPTGAASRKELGDERWSVYELVVRRFLATLSPDARWTTQKIQMRAGEEPYVASGSRLEAPGWRQVYHYGEIRENALPPLEKSDNLPIHGLILDAKETQPPPRYAQSRLIQRMEELGLGTKSTRHEVLGKLLSRRYIHGNPLRPTLVGRAVIEALEDHADTITKPEMTQRLDSHMQQIKERILTQSDVVSESRGILQRIFDELEAHRQEIGEEIRERTAEERVIGHCPICGGTLCIRQMKTMGQFIGCTRYPDCTFNINLPGMQWGKAVRTDTICPTHQVRHVRLVKKGARPWDIGCPLCSHISSHAESLRLIPSMTEGILAQLHNHHLYTIHELAGNDATRLTSLLGIGGEEARRLIEEAGDVLILLRRRSELKKFIRTHLPLRKGRSQSAIMTKLFAAGINDVRSLAHAEPATLKGAGIGEKEATTLRQEAQLLCSERLLKEIGIPSSSLKKYLATGITTPEAFCSLPAFSLSTQTGLSLDTVMRHLALVCGYLGREPPNGPSRRAVEQGRKELLSTPGLGEVTLEKLHRAGVYNRGGLAHADLAHLAAITGLSEATIRGFIVWGASHTT